MTGAGNAVQERVSAEEGSSSFSRTPTAMIPKTALNRMDVEIMQVLKILEPLTAYLRYAIFESCANNS